MEKLFEDYLTQIKNARSEDARFHIFSVFLHKLFQIKPEDLSQYLQNINVSLKGKLNGGLIRRRPDSLFGNVVLEFEYDLKKRSEVKEAEKQLLEVLRILREKDPDYPYVGIASDGVIFIVYALDDEGLKKLEEIDLSKAKPYEAFYFLDRYFVRKESRPLTADLILKDLGVNSFSFVRLTGILRRLLNEYIKTPSVEVLYREWNRYISIAYGEDVASEELFVRHTYLSLVLKILIMKILGQRDKWENVIKGTTFKNIGIENLFEEDFFCWVLRENILEKIEPELNRMLALVDTYELSEVNEDVLKELYQGIVDPQTRHDLGEFYTPDWLAHKMVKEVVSENPDAKMLDPACGSGTFLYFAILEKKKHGKELKEILEEVVGIDIHPLAVLTSRTNYLLAIRDFLDEYRDRVFIPVYLADSLRIPEKRGLIKDEYLEVETFDRKVFVPRRIVDNAQLLDKVLYETGKLLQMEELIPKSGFEGIFRRIGLSPQEIGVLYTAFYVPLKALKDDGRDTIWIFILSNIFRPLMLEKQFDVVMGNPPWIVLRTIRNKDYQAFVKNMVKDFYKLETRAKNITHIEVAILFLMESLRRFARDEGEVIFVLTRSVFNASHHKNFRAGGGSMPVKIEEVWDLENVKPLFNYPSLVLKVRKGETVYPIKALYFEGILGKRNESLEEASRRLRVEERRIYLISTSSDSENFWSYENLNIPLMRSAYYGDFYQGATIIPRNIYFVEIVRDMGDFYLVKGANNVQSKRPYNHKFEEIFGSEVIEIEKEFVFDTILGGDVVPFGILRTRKVILPIRVDEHGHIELIDSREALKRGYIRLYEFLQKAEAYWNRYSKGNLTLYERLDYQHGLTRQRVKKGYKVVYPDAARQVVSSVIGPLGIVDTTLYYFEATSKPEVFYLSSFFNSETMQQIMEYAYDIRNKKENPHFHKKPLELIPIPRFDSEDKLHVELARISENLHLKVAEILKDPEIFSKPVGWIRRHVKQQIETELRNIDRIVENILKFRL